LTSQTICNAASAIDPTEIDKTSKATRRMNCKKEDFVLPPASAVRGFLEGKCIKKNVFSSGAQFSFVCFFGENPSRGKTNNKRETNNEGFCNMYFWSDARARRWGSSSTDNYNISLLSAYWNG
jgi:hypothetical protein